MTTWKELHEKLNRMRGAPPDADVRILTKEEQARFVEVMCEPGVLTAKGKGKAMTKLRNPKCTMNLTLRIHDVEIERDMPKDRRDVQQRLKYLMAQAAIAGALTVNRAEWRAMGGSHLDPEFDVDATLAFE